MRPIVKPVFVTPNRSISPIPIRYKITTYTMVPQLKSPPKTELKVSKTYRSVTPTPNLKDIHNKSTNTLVIENVDPANMRLQSLNQKKSELYQDLNKLSNENKNLNSKLTELHQHYHSNSETMTFNQTLITELTKIKEILTKCDFKNIANFSEISLQSAEFETIQSLVSNINNNLKFFEEKVFSLARNRKTR